MVQNSNGIKKLSSEPSSAPHFSVTKLLPEVNSVIHFLYIHLEDVYMYSLFFKHKL